MGFRFFTLLCLLIGSGAAVRAQTASRPMPAVGREGPKLRYVIVLSRHGVRSPTGKPEQYDRYSAGRWPEWPVQPGYLTPHGFRLMQIFGAYDRSELAAAGLLAAEGCSDSSRIQVYADSDQRTRETGRAIAQGLMPGCNLAVTALPEGTNDPIFHSRLPADDPEASATAYAAVAGRVGGDAAKITEAYRQQITSLDHILATCGRAAGESAERISLLDVPASLAQGTGDHAVELKGPLYTASTLSENLLLEYTEGMDEAKVGWSCVHRAELQSLLQLHAAAVDFSQRTPFIARAQAASLLSVLRLSLQQAATDKPIEGAIGTPGTRALFLIGHDTNIENLAGALNLTWIVDGRRDDTPPGGALEFELWQRPGEDAYSVRVFYTAQTLEQMRNSTALSLKVTPERAAIFIPGCSRADLSCTLPAFLRVLESEPAPSR